MRAFVRCVDQMKVCVFCWMVFQFLVLIYTDLLSFALAHSHVHIKFHPFFFSISAKMFIICLFNRVLFHFLGVCLGEWV